jgi:phosphomannomutase
VITGGDEGSQYNGVKLITSRMAIAPEDTTRQIEAELEQLAQAKHPLQVTASKGEKKLCNPKQGYFRHLQGMVDLEQIKTVSEHVLVDYLHGIASGYLRELLRSVGGDIQERQNSALYDFGGINPTLFTDNFIDFHREASAHDGLSMGLMIDGDGTNLQVFDGQGQLLSHGDIFALIVDYFITHKEKVDGIVKPVQRNDLAEKIAIQHDVPIYFAQTTDFRVMTTHMVQDMANLAADGLGGYAFEGHIMERDAIFTSLLLMEILAVRKLSLQDAIADLHQRYPESADEA